MAYLDTKHLVLVIGLVGMVLLLNNFALVVSCTMKRLTPVIGPRMLVDVRNIVSFEKKIARSLFTH